MSQAKVDRQKELKKNRKKIVAKEKRRNRLYGILGYVCLICIVVGIGFSVYQKVNPEPESDGTAFYRLIATDDYGILSPSIEDAE